MYLPTRSTGLLKRPEVTQYTVVKQGQSMKSRANRAHKMVQDKLTDWGFSILLQGNNKFHTDISTGLQTYLQVLQNIEKLCKHVWSEAMLACLVRSFKRSVCMYDMNLETLSKLRRCIHVFKLFVLYAWMRNGQKSQCLRNTLGDMKVIISGGNLRKVQ